MIIVEQGRIVEACAEPGEFTFDASTEPSLLSGNLDSNFGDTLRTIADRIAYGGDTGKDQRVYYFNIKELVGNKFGTPTPVPFRVVDQNIGLDIDISVRCNGIYSYRITNPLLFYANVCGNVREAYTRAEIDSQLKSEFMSALQPAFAKISTMGIRYSAIPGHRAIAPTTTGLADTPRVMASGPTMHRVPVANAMAGRIMAIVSSGLAETGMVGLVAQLQCPPSCQQQIKREK